MSVNGVTVSKRTNDLNEAIKSLKPAMCHTEAYLTARKGNIYTERRINLTQLRRVFSDDDVREVFVNNLLLTLDA